MTASFIVAERLVVRDQTADRHRRATLLSTAPFTLFFMAIRPKDIALNNSRDYNQIRRLSQLQTT